MPETAPETTNVTQKKKAKRSRQYMTISTTTEKIVARGNSLKSMRTNLVYAENETYIEAVQIGAPFAVKSEVKAVRVKA